MPARYTWTVELLNLYKCYTLDYIFYIYINDKLQEIPIDGCYRLLIKPTCVIQMHYLRPVLP